MRLDPTTFRPIQAKQSNPFSSKDLRNRAARHMAISEAEFGDFSYSPMTDNDALTAKHYGPDHAVRNLGANLLAARHNTLLDEPFTLMSDNEAMTAKHYGPDHAVRNLGANLLAARHNTVVAEPKFPFLDATSLAPSQFAETAALFPRMAVAENA